MKRDDRRVWSRIVNLVQCVARGPAASARLIASVPKVQQGREFAEAWAYPTVTESGALIASHEDDELLNPLAAYFQSRVVGRGIWKWEHYFDIYHRHFSKFVGGEVNILEVGVYSGGSLEMWRHYFGPSCTIHGVDIVPACKGHENSYTKIYVGDQADREFWADVKERVPRLDILVDDGGHGTTQQIVTLEEMLPHLRPGGVYLCEDIHGANNEFTSYLQGMVGHFNSFNRGARDVPVSTTPFQAAIQSIHLYPYVAVIEKRDRPIPHLQAPRRGTEWQPSRL